MRRYKPSNSKISVDERGRVSFTEEISSAKYKGYPTKYAEILDNYTPSYNELFFFDVLIIFRWRHHLKKIP